MKGHVMMTDTDAASVAREACDWFETRTRDDGSRYVVLKDGHPGWIYDAVRRAHGNMLPDDRIFKLCRDAFAFISDNDATADDAHDFADSAVDVYTGDRIAWLASHLGRVGLCDEAADDLGGDGLGIAERIGLGQYVEAQGVYAAVFRACEAQADDA